MSTGIPEPVMTMLVALVRIVPEAINAFSEDGKKAIIERLDNAAARLPEPGAIDAATEALIARHRARVSPQVTTSTADVLAKLTTSIRLSDEERHALVQAVGVLDILTAPEPTVDEKGS